MGIFGLFRRNTAADAPAPTKNARRSRRPAGMKVVFRGMGSAAGMPEAGDTDHLTAGWATTPASINAVVEQKWRILCARGREVAYNSDHGKNFIRLVKTNVVGPKGIVIIPAVMLADGKTPDDLARDAIAAAFSEWAKCPEITGRMSWREVQAVCIQTVARDGEIFVRRLKGRAYGKFHYQLQLVDPVRVPVHYRAKLPNGNRIRAGIEFTPEGKVVAYYVRTDLDDYLDAVEYMGEAFQRIPAAEMFHLFIPEAINQPRGLSWMGTALVRLHHLNKFETAAVINARVGAAKMGFFEGDPEYLEPDEQDEDGEGYQEDFPMDADPGTFERIPIGYKLHEFNPQYPQGEFDAFAKSILHSIAAGLGISYASLSGDLSKVNYSSIRAGVLNEREMWKELQDWFIEKFVQPVFEEWVAVAVLAQAITIGRTPLRVERVAQYKRARFQPRRWSWVDPSKDIKAQRDAHDGCMKSISETIRELGGDPDEVFEEIAEEKKKMEALGITPKAQKQTAPAAPEDMEDSNAEPETDD